MDITGRVIVINWEQKISEKFVKREFVIETGDKYPQQLQFQLTQDKVDLIDPYKTGDEIKVFFNLRGRSWANNQGETKWFNALEAWKLERISDQRPVISPEEEREIHNMQPADEDSLPF